VARENSDPAEKPALPIHIAVIMDGNGRWARQKGKPRTYGHKQGIDAAKRVIRAAIDLGIPYLTLYTFSTENWSRPKREVNFLMRLLKHHMKYDVAFYHENRIRLRHAGYLQGLPKDIQEEMGKRIEATKNYDAITTVLAINYGGRDEILRAFARLYRSYEEKSPAEREGKICRVEDLSAHLDNPDVPDPDLVVRSAGEKRISNFLLWESAYAEFFYSDKLWPDWAAEDLREAVEEFGRRKRKFGGNG
jgi:undecaprenyl diphosphate synthase